MTQRTYSAEVKLAVAKDAIKGELSIREIVKKYGLSSPALVVKWRRQLLEHGSKSFTSVKRGPKMCVLPPPQENLTENEELRRKVDYLMMEVDVLKKLCALKAGSS